MGKFIEVHGNTIAQAIQRGLSDLDVSIDEVVTEVITHPKSGFFGFGASKAKVRLTIKEVEQSFEQPVEKTVIVKNETPQPVIEKPVVVEDKTPQEPKAPLVIKKELSENDKKAKEFIDELLAKMGIDGTADILESDGANINVNIVGEGLGTVIGRRGDTLDAMQYIANLVVKNNGESDVKVRVDCQNYREKREQTIEKLALKMGHKVLKYKKNMTLEPMNPYERRMIHEVLQNFRGVFTYSTGKEPNRRVVIGFGEGKESRTEK